MKPLNPNFMTQKQREILAKATKTISSRPTRSEKYQWRVVETNYPCDYFDDRTSGIRTDSEIMDSERKKEAIDSLMHRTIDVIDEYLSERDCLIFYLIYRLGFTQTEVANWINASEKKVTTGKLDQPTIGKIEVKYIIPKIREIWREDEVCRALMTVMVDGDYDELGRLTDILNDKPQ